MRIFRLFILVFAPAVFAAAPAEHVLCGKITVVGQESLSLSTVEERLVCGDPGNPTWSRVPLPQAQYWLRVFLQERGYFFPKFVLAEDSLQVELGAPTDVAQYRIEGIPADAEWVRFRGIKGQRLTPKLLDEVQKRYRAYLEANGYPCAEIQPTADAPHSSLNVRLLPKEKMRIYELEVEPIPELERGALTRYFAFEKGNDYNADYLSVTTDRIINSGMAQSAFFSTQCEPSGARLKLTTVAGPPRVFSVGFSVSTDRLAELTTSWKNNRWGTAGSQLGISFRGNRLEQQLKAESDYYLPSLYHRFFLHPEISILRRDINESENYTGYISLEPSVTWDSTHVGYRFSMGPSVQFHHTARGAGPKFSNYVTLSSKFSVLDHYYEFYQRDPQQGFRMDLDLLSTQRGLASTLTAHRLRWSGERLWNLFSYSPSLLVLGMRWAAGTTLTDQRVESLVDDFRHYLGGRSDMRGFSPRELPDPKGAMTTATASVELRLTHVFPWKIDPLVFVDVGMLGKESLKLDKTVFYSPGFGVRWNSPIGAIRATLANPNGIAWGDGLGYRGDHKWQLYFSLGEEF